MPKRKNPLSRAVVLAAGLAASIVAVQSARADCALDNEVPISLLSPGFEAWKAISGAMEECGNVTAELDQEFRSKQVPAFEARPALYTIAGVNAATFASLTEKALLRPLDDLIAEYGQDIAANQKVVVGGETLGIAVMLNTQNLFYRTDIFEQLGLEVPTTYDEVLEAAAAIQEADLVDYPLGGTFKTGFDLGEEFVNMYLGFGGTLVGEDREVTLDREAGAQTLEMLRRMTEFMDPEFVISDSTYVQQQFQQGRIAMANLWASRAGAMDDPAESEVIGLVGSAPAPSAEPDGLPAATIWWGGWGIATNVTDEEAEAAFRVMVEATDTEMVRANNDANIWLIEGYEPPALAKGAIATMQAGAPSYPASSAMSILHSEIGNVVADYLLGNKDAETVLGEIEDKYRLSATEAGLLGG